jgi:hypothetical protein
MVSVFRREVQHKMMIFRNREIVDVDRNTNFFTQNRWHMNSSGKDMIVRT